MACGHLSLSLRGVFRGFRGCASWKAGNRRWHLACRRFCCPKDEDLTISGRLLGVKVIARLRGLCFDEMEEGKGRDFDGTFKLSTLTVVVIFLHAALDFYFVLSLIITMVFPSSKLVVCSSDLDLGDLLVVLDLWLCMVFGDLCDLRSWLPIIGSLRR
ncbi:hypothetical protein TIFTF001_003200 [Ficus carica]|uniref:Uncharacterized protein n=1 Tax=Ficus carica TaxID=3494 RepID=A0AA87ZET1_FICCA|nr:hypothetical protein TIFTF001_003200 [Ficus carica]